MKMWTAGFVLHCACPLTVFPFRFAFDRMHSRVSSARGRKKSIPLSLVPSHHLFRSRSAVRVNLSPSVRWECECSGTFFALSLTASEDFERAVSVHAPFLTRGWVRCLRFLQEWWGNPDGRGRRGEINQFHVTKRNPGRMILQLMETQIEIVRRKITILSARSSVVAVILIKR